MSTPNIQDQYDQDCDKAQADYDASEREEETEISDEQREADRVDLLVHRNKEDEDL